MEHNDFLWEEVYRPKTLADCILPAALKKQFTAFIQAGNLQNMLFFGPAGIGKTTVAKALMNDLDADYLFINGSLNGNIDTLRYDVANFASTVSMTGGRKYVIFDEADYMNPNSTQPALRGMTEEFSENCSFIFTCNDISRIIKPIRDSRLAKFNFTIPKAESKDLAIQFFRRAKTILDKENVQYDDKSVAALVQHNFPDFRQTLVQMHSYAVTNGKIDTGILGQFSNEAMKELASIIKAKKFTDARKWIGEHSELLHANFFRSLFDTLSPSCDPENTAALVTIVADYQFKAAHVADAEINSMACVAVIMAEIAFR
jgi:DNA polymerase III delta prime subunit